MRKLFATLTIFFLFVAPMLVEAANCPTEVKAAKEMLKKQTAKIDSESQAPRALAGAVSRESNAPRTQEANAPRADRESNAPRSREANAPRADRESNAPRTLRPDESQAPRTLRPDESQAPRTLRPDESQAPRGQDTGVPRTAASAPQLSKARILVNEAEAACKAGDMTKASEKAKAAMELLKK